MRVAVLTTDSREHYKDYQCREPYFGAAPEALLSGFKQLPEVEVHVISCLQREVISPEKLASNIWYHGLHVPWWGWLRTGYQGCIRAVRSRVRAIHPDIVHGQGTERDCAICAVFSGAPNVVTIHGNMAELARLFGARWGSYAWFAARLEGFALSRTAGVFCNSAYTEELVKSKARRTWRVANAIREEFFSIPMSGHPPQKATLINIGVINARKRQIELLEVIRELHEEGTPIHMRFIGHASQTEPYAREFSERMAIASSKGYASYLGLLSTAEIIRSYDEAHGLVHFPSEEAFGLIAPEALARKVRLFASAVGGLVDIAAGLPDAHLYGVDDWAGLKNGLRMWVKNGYPRASGATDTMFARYNPKAIAEQHREIYGELLSSLR